MGSHFVFLLSVMIGYFLVNAPSIDSSDQTIFQNITWMFFFLFLSICLMFLHLRVDCLIIENLETLESDGNCSTSFHFSLSLVILPRFNNTSVTEHACRKVRCTGAVLDSQLVCTRFETVTGFQFGLNLAWEWRAPRYKLCSEFSFCRCLSDVSSTLHKV